VKVLDVDFAPKRPLPAWMWVGLTLIFAAIAAQQGWQAWKLRQRALTATDEAAALSAQIERAQQARREAQTRARVQPPYAKDAAAIAQMATFPLDRVLRVLESVRVQGVKLKALDISAAEGSVRVELEYTANDALMSYMDEINAGEAKPRWQMLQAQAGSGPGAASMATIASQWSEADR